MHSLPCDRCGGPVPLPCLDENIEVRRLDQSEIACSDCRPQGAMISGIEVHGEARVDEPGIRIGE